MFILNLPHTHASGSLREPVCVLEPLQQKLYIIGKLQAKYTFPYFLM